MKRDFGIELIGLGGHKLVDGDNVSLTLGTVAVSALMGQYQDEQGISGDEKFRRYQIASRVSASGIQEISIEDISLIKRLIGNAYTPMVVGPAYMALEREPETATAV
jgi:hypothetical protein